MAVPAFKQFETQQIGILVATGQNRDILIGSDEALVRNNVKFMFEKMGRL